MKKLLCIIISITMAFVCMPLAAGTAFAVEKEAGQTPEQEPVKIEFKEMSVASIYIASYNYKSVTVGWSAVEGATGYQLYRATSKSGKYKKAVTTKGRTYKDSGNKTIGKYRYYKVRAYKTEGKVTTYSKFSKILAAGPNLPGPGALTVTAQSSSVKLKWNKVSGAKKYQVYRAASATGKYSRICTTKKLYCTNSSVTKAKKYFYKVRAYRYVNGKRKTGKFCAAVIGASKPATPKNVSATCANGIITVKWSAVSRADYYNVYRSVNKTSGFSRIGTSATTSYADQDGLIDGTTYYYKVSASVNLGTKTATGSLSIGEDRDAVIAQAKSWHGAVEGSSTQKSIVSIYNNSSCRAGGRVGYSSAWCATFVSAVFIKTGLGNLVRCDCYCPNMLKAFAAKKDRTYAPSGGDVIFYDWNYNNVPDHVGLITGYDSTKQKVTAIEGNTTCDGKSKKDHVAYRTFSRGWKLILKYGIPAYNDGYKVQYAAALEPEEAENVENCIIEDPVDDKAVEGVQEVVEENSDQSDETVVENIVDYIQEEAPASAESADCSESVYDAFLLMDVCENNDIPASVITTVDDNGNMESYNEILLDGTLFTVDASQQETLISPSSSDIL